MADLKSEKLNLHLSQCIVLQYCFSYLWLSSCTYTTIALAPMPPVVEKTSGEKDSDPYKFCCSD